MNWKSTATGQWESDDGNYTVLLYHHSGGKEGYCAIKTMGGFFAGMVTRANSLEEAQEACWLNQRADSARLRREAVAPESPDDGTPRLSPATLES